MWDFSTEPEFQRKLDWAQAFVRDECEALDLLFPHHGDPYDVNNAASRAILKPLVDMFLGSAGLALADGPTEVHKAQVAKALLGTARPQPGLFPSEHIPTRLAEARQRYAHLLKAHGLAAE